MRIVCGTDFSANAAQAVDAAVAVARRAGDAIELVCATGGGPHLASLPDTAQGIMATELARTEQLAAEVSRWHGAGVALDGVLDAASPAEALVRRAGEPGTRLVVLGAVGHSLLSRLLVGSVAERVAMASPVPALVVRDGVSWQAWGAGKRDLRLVVAFDRGRSSRGALAWGRWLAALGGVQLTVCWVVHPAFENERAGATGAGAGVELLPATRTALQDELARETEGAIPASAALHLEPNLGRIDHALAHYARTVEADLLVVGSHQRQGWERLWEASVSRGVLHHAPMDVAVVPYMQIDE